MAQHYTRLTVSVAAYCSKCRKTTQHKVTDRRRGPCLDCIANLEIEAKAEKPKPAAVQAGLFAEVR